MDKYLKYYNGFGITPKNTYISAGTDFFVPNIDSRDNEMVARVEDAFFLDPENPKKAHSYACTSEQAQELQIMFEEALTTKFNDLEQVNQILERHWHNILHLYLALQSINIEEIRLNNGNLDGYFIEDVYYFVDNYLVFDKQGIPGIRMNTLDHVLFNSGIKVALCCNNVSDCGLDVNKSGRGSSGWDVRAQLIDEDYGGYVHLSSSYTMNTYHDKRRIVYCGDKILQMMVFEVKHYVWDSVSEDEYEELMKNSERKANALGSSDVQH